MKTRTRGLLISTCLAFKTWAAFKAKADVTDTKDISYPLVNTQIVRR